MPNLDEPSKHGASELTAQKKKKPTYLNKQGGGIAAAPQIFHPFSTDTGAE